MQVVLTLVAPDADVLRDAVARASEALARVGPEVAGAGILGDVAADLFLEAEDAAATATVAGASLDGLPVDVCAQAVEHRRKGLLVADMDSTIIGCECLDELADFAGLKAEISAITERAMRGEMDFEAALDERVRMLRGLPVEALERCYAERVRLNPGARTLVRTMAANGARCVLVSGGFDFFTSRVGAHAGFHLDRSNHLMEEGGALTGRVARPIVGRETKLETLLDEARTLGLDLNQTLAVGDGANDLDMIRAAGLGVAYRAKPIVAAQAHARVDHADLTALLYFQGYPADAFVTD